MDIAFGVHIEMQNAGAARAFLVHPADRLLHASLDQAVFYQNHPFEKQNALVPLGPGRNLIGIKQNGFRIAGSVLSETDHLLRGACQGECHHGQDGQQQTTGGGSPGQRQVPMLVSSGTFFRCRREVFQLLRRRQVENLPAPVPPASP